VPQLRARRLINSHSAGAGAGIPSPRLLTNRKGGSITMIELRKGQKIDLSKKDGSQLTHVLVGLGWDQGAVAPEGKRGFFAKLMKGSEAPARDVDIDASVLLADANGKVASNQDVVYFAHKTHSSGAIVHIGDNLVGGKMGGMEDSEQIKVDLSKVPASISRLAFIVNIYDCVSRRQHFGMVHNAYIRIIDQDSKEQLARYSLTDDYKDLTSIVVGEAVRDGSGWSFSAIGEGGSATSISQMVQAYNDR